MSIKQDHLKRLRPGALRFSIDPIRARVVASLALLLSLVFASGCVSHVIAKAFTDAPNGGRETVDDDRPSPAIYDDRGQLDVPGPPEATLAYWVMEPGPGRVTFVPENAPPPAANSLSGWRFVDSEIREGKGFIRNERGPVNAETPPQATVLLLHGWGSQTRSSDSLWQLSTTLADAGCRVILPDLRGLGDSTGEFVTFGFREVEDLSALLDYVEENLPGGLTEPVGVVGHSYGGSIAIQLATHDSRVKRVLGLAPLADIRTSMLPGVRLFARRLRPIAWVFYLNWAIDQKAIDKAQRIMQQRTGTDFSTNNAFYQITQATVPVLILQGGKDEATPLYEAEKLRDANPHRVELVVYPEANHTSFLRDDFEDVERRLRGWIDALIATPTP